MIAMLITAALLIAADQGIKYWAQTVLAAQGSMPFWKNVVSLVYVRNTGAAFGIFSNGTWFFIAVTAIALAAVLVILVRVAPRKIHLLNWSLVLILAGGVGNLIDRTALGYVVDMFCFEFMEFPVFNFADILITVGAPLLLIFVLFFYDRYFPEKKKQKEEEKKEETEDAVL